MTIQTFPSITEDEFQEACKALEDRSADRLDDTDWLSVRWSGKELIIKQRREIRRSDDVLPDGDDEVDSRAEDSADIVCISACCLCAY